MAWSLKVNLAAQTRPAADGFVYTGLETLGGEGMWGEVSGRVGVRPSDGLLILYPSDLYWRLQIIATDSNDNERFRQEK